MILEEIFFQLGAVLVIAAGLSLIAHRLKQPLIIAYIITGILVGPEVWSLANQPDLFEALSKIGVAFLLFTVGLGLNWRHIKEVGRVSLATGVGQVVFTTIAGFGLGKLLGLETVTSLYLATAFTFSSTIIVIKLLMDKEESDTLYGRISVGFLIVQDLIAMLLLLGLGSFESGASIGGIIFATLLKVAIIVPLVWFVSSKIAPKIIPYAARSQELLFIFSIAWCFLIAGILVLFGFGVELGALLAGVMLSGTTMQREINARIRPLRDFFLVLFFVVLGTHLGLGDMSTIAWPAFIFSLFILIGNPIIMLLIMRLLGYHPRTGFLVGTTIAQISEFSFIVIGAGITAGYLEPSVLSLTTLVGLITIAGSTYLVNSNEWVYLKLRGILKFLEPKKSIEDNKGNSLSPQVTVFGYHSIARQMITSLKKTKLSYRIIDFDPFVVRLLEQEKVPVLYGDASDIAYLTELQVEQSRFIISTVPSMSVSLTLLSYLSEVGYTGTVIVAARTSTEATHCYEAGAAFVIIPNQLGAEKLAEIFSNKKTRRQSWEELGKKAQTQIL